jgi:hypothetical protein
MEKNFNKGPFSVGEKKIESTWENCLKGGFLKYYLRFLGKTNF